MILINELLKVLPFYATSLTPEEEEQLTSIQREKSTDSLTGV